VRAEKVVYGYTRQPRQYESERLEVTLQVESGETGDDVFLAARKFVLSRLYGEPATKKETEGVEGDKPPGRDPVVGTGNALGVQRVGPGRENARLAASAHNGVRAGASMGVEQAAHVPGADPRVPGGARGPAAREGAPGR
jgi:hypothetical protein